MANSGSISAKVTAVEGEVPRGVPGILPCVGHRDDVAVVQVPPIGLRLVTALRRRWRLQRVAFEPAADVEPIELLRPQHAGQRLALHQPRVRVGDAGVAATA